MSSSDIKQAQDSTYNTQCLMDLMRVHNNLMLEQVNQMKKQNELLDILNKNIANINDDQNELLNTLNNSIANIDDGHTLSESLHDIASHLSSIEYSMPDSSYYSNNNGGSNHCCCRRS